MCRDQVRALLPSGVFRRIVSPESPAAMERGISDCVCRVHIRPRIEKKSRHLDETQGNRSVQRCVEVALFGGVDETRSLFPVPQTCHDLVDIVRLNMTKESMKLFVWGVSRSRDLPLLRGGGILEHSLRFSQEAGVSGVNS